MHVCDAGSEPFARWTAQLPVLEYMQDLTPTVGLAQSSLWMSARVLTEAKAALDRLFSQQENRYYSD